MAAHHAPSVGLMQPWDVIVIRDRVAHARIKDTSTLPTLTANGVPFTMGWSLDQPVALKLAWDQVNGKFTFAATDVVTLTQESRDIVYLGTVTDAGHPIGDFKGPAVANDRTAARAARPA